MLSRLRPRLGLSSLLLPCSAMQRAKGSLTLKKRCIAHHFINTMLLNRFIVFVRTSRRSQ